MKVVRIRSHRTAHAYIGTHAPPLADADGFVDTGDMVELRGERYHFVGRRGGVINIGGLKVHPEEVETVINRHESVRMSRARSRRSPITSAIVVAASFSLTALLMQVARKRCARKFSAGAKSRWLHTRCWR
jgi:acyl-CoA synthetase (AMP-forming)/AMP-acid ligase II